MVDYWSVIAGVLTGQILWMLIWRLIKGPIYRLKNEKKILSELVWRCPERDCHFEISTSEKHILPFMVKAHQQYHESKIVRLEKCICPGPKMILGNEHMDECPWNGKFGVGKVNWRNG